MIGAAWFDYRQRFSSVNTVAANPPSQAAPAARFESATTGRTVTI
jgi:hypothetical protein